MKEMRFGRALTFGVLAIIVAGAQGQAFLNENFNGPGLPGWEVTGEALSSFSYDVSGGSFNARGFTNGSNNSLDMTRQLLSQTAPAPNTWEFESRFFLPVADQFYNVPLSYSDGSTQYSYFGVLGTNNQNTSGIITVNRGILFAVREASLNSWHVLKIAVTPTATVGYLDGIELGNLQSAGTPTLRKVRLSVNLDDSDMQANPLRLDRITIVPEPATSSTLIAVMTMLLARHRKNR